MRCNREAKYRGRAFPPNDLLYFMRILKALKWDSITLLYSVLGSRCNLGLDILGLL